jgi:hypothetical protein
MGWRVGLVAIRLKLAAMRLVQVLSMELGLERKL